MVRMLVRRSDRDSDVVRRLDVRRRLLVKARGVVRAHRMRS